MNRIRRLGDPWTGRLARLGGQHVLNEWVQEANFEAGALTPNPTGWDAVVNAGGGFAASAVSPLSGNYSFVATVENTNLGDNGYLTDPNNEKFIALEYLLSENLIMGGGEGFNYIAFTSSGAGGFSLGVTRLGTGVTRFTATLDVGASNVDYTIPAGVHRINIELNISSAPGADDGYLAVYVDGVQVGANTGLNNDTHNVNAVGVRVAGVDAGTSGTVKIDNFRWSRKSIVNYSP